APHCAGRTKSATEQMPLTAFRIRNSLGAVQDVTKSNQPKTRGSVELNKRLKASGLSLDGLAILTGVSKATIHRVLNLVNVPTIRTAQKLETVLGVKVEWWSRPPR